MRSPVSRETSSQVMPNDTHLGNKPSTRRSFLKLGAASALTSGLIPLRTSGGYAETQGNSPLRNLPELDGQLLIDHANRQLVAEDFGRHVRRMPVAVLRPRSVNDIVKIAAYANRKKIKVAMRGRGHSSYGQAQLDGGIVIDSSSLSDVRWSGIDTVDAEPGILWRDVAQFTLERGLTPPIIPDTMVITVGGTLSVGGLGETSHRYGAQVDHVLELRGLHQVVHP